MQEEPRAALLRRRLDRIRCYCDSIALTGAAARRANAAMVRVGLAVAEVGKTAEPRMKRLGWSWLRRSASTTELLGSAYPRGADDMPGPLRIRAMRDARCAKP